MSLDLSDMMEDLFAAEDSQVNARGGSIITLIDKKAAREIAREVSKKDLLELAGDRSLDWAVGEWQSFFATTTTSAGYGLS